MGPAIKTSSNKGIVYLSSFDNGLCADNSLGCSISVAQAIGLKAPTRTDAWTSPSTMGMDDIGGVNNFYIEDNYFAGFWQSDMDFDDDSKSVTRHNIFDNSALGSHGADTSYTGVRHYEIYDNTFIFSDMGNSTYNLNWWFFDRGGTGVITDNVMPDIKSQAYGDKTEITMIVMNLQRNSGSNPCWGFGVSGNQYPAPRQVGRGRVTGTGVDGKGRTTDMMTYVGDSEPMYIWNNTGSYRVGVNDYGWDPATSCGTSAADLTANADVTSNYIVAGRDYFNDGTAKPGYTKYTYPHPLRTQGSNPPPSNIVPAATCSDADVQSAITSAMSGNVVTVPAGNCTWNNTVTISGKMLTLQGAGIGQTNITDNGSGGAALAVNSSAANMVRVTGFTFIKGADHPYGIVQFDGALMQIAFRFDHNRILQATSGSRGIATYSVFGLIDHNIFDMTAPSGSVQQLSFYGSSVGTDGGFTPWMSPLTLGSANAVYVEDNIISASNQAESAEDSYTGARWVIRYNAINNCEVGGGHGTDSGGNRSFFSGEIYNNAYTNTSGSGIRGATVRGGTVVVHDNTYSGSWYGITLMNYRSCPSLDQSDWGTCDGTNWEIGSKIFSAQGSRTCSPNGGVKFCAQARDTVCTSDADCGSSGGTCSTYFDGSASGGYACRDQVGRTHNQALAPIYVWNNGSVLAGTYNGGPGVACGAGIDTYIQLNRDYYNDTPMPGYTAFTYPYPLTSDGFPNPTGPGVTPPPTPTPTPTPTPPAVGSVATDTQFLPFKNIFNPTTKETMTIKFSVAGEASSSSLQSSALYGSSGNSGGLSVVIYDRTGTLVRRLDRNGGTATWDGKNSQGQVVASGVYFVMLGDGKNAPRRKLMVVK